MSALKLSAWVRILVVLGILAGVGFSVIGDYGVSWDEEREILSVKENLDYILHGTPMYRNQQYYGVVFNAASEILFQIQLRLRRILPVAEQFKRHKPYAVFYQKIQVKHVFTFLVSLLAFVSAMMLVGIFLDWKWAWLGGFALALIPRFWGHAFFNPKDIPFAAFFSFGIVLGSFWVRDIADAEKKDLKWSMFGLGILTGLLSGIRIAGVSLMAFVLMAHLILMSKQNLMAKWKMWLSGYGWMAAGWFLTVMAVYPFFWKAPVAGISEAIQTFSHFSWDKAEPMKVLFEGHLVSALAVPWYYIPKWFFMTVPFGFQIFFVSGLILFFLQYAKFSTLQRAAVILVVCQIFVLPLVAILNHSTLYDGIRHFLFIMPGVAAVAVYAWGVCFKKLPNQFLKAAWVLISVLYFAGLVSEMKTLHPYEFIYFNRISGGVPGSQGCFDTDYWGLSFREGMEWINARASEGARVVISNPYVSGAAFARSDLELIKESRLNASSVIPRPFYYLVIVKATPHFAKFENCSAVYEVTRHGVPLSQVKECR